MIPYGISALLYAPLSRKLSFRVIMSATMGLYGLSSLLCARVELIEHFFLARIASGITGAAVIPLGLVIIGKVFERSIRGRLVGLFFGCSFVASLAGVFLSGVGHWRCLFFVPAGLGFLSAILMVLIPSEDLSTTEKNPINYLNIIYNINIRNIFIFIFILSLLYHGVHAWFGVYLSQKYGLSQFYISLIFILMAVAGFAGQIIGGIISDKKGRFASCFLGIVVLGLSTVLLSFYYPVAVLTLILIVFSMGWTIGHNGASTVITDFPEQNRAEVASLNSSVRFLSGGIGFMVSAPFVERSFDLTFLFIGILMIFLIFFVRKAVPEQQ